jgi:TRAP-type mannitol/chloroaromatic compound transport system permease small subunit
MSYEKTTDLEAPPEEGAAPDSIFGWFIDGCNGLGSLVIFATMLLVCSDIVARDFFNSPIHGVAELVSLSIVAVLFLQLASTLRHGRMSRADIFIDGYRNRHPLGGAVLQVFFDICGATACVIVAYATLPILRTAWEGSEFIGVVGVFTAPTWPVRAIVVIGAAAAALQYLVGAWTHIKAAATTNELGDGNVRR